MSDAYATESGESEIERDNVTRNSSAAARSLTLLTTGWAVLTVVAAGGVAYGLRQRLREYR